MPGKSRHRPRKQTFRSKKSKGRLSPPVSQPQAVAQTTESIPPPQMLKKSAPTPVATVRYPYVLPELRRIGILAGIMLVILIVLALVW